jgi:O-antigen/teichoic acid export membrane protein
LRSSDFIFGFFFIVLASRFLDMADFGKLMYAVSYTAIFAIFAEMGLSRYLMLNTAQNSRVNRPFLRKTTLLKHAFSGLSYFVMLIVILFLKNEWQARVLVAVIGFSVILLSYSIFYNSIFRSLERTSFQFVAAFWEKPILLILTVVFALSGWGLLAFGVAILLSRVIPLLIARYLLQKKIEYDPQDDDSSINLVLKNSLPFALFAIFGSIYNQIDTVILSSLKGDEAVAIYQAALRLILIILVLPEAITESIFPRLTQLYSSSSNDRFSFQRRSVKFLVLVGFMVSMIFFILSDVLIRVIYGEQYLEASLILKLMSGILVIRFSAYVLGTALTAAMQQTTRTIAVAMTCVINIALNFWLIPKYGVIGATVSAIATNVFLLILYAVAAWRRSLMRFSDYLVELVTATALFVICLILNSQALAALLLFSALVFFWFSFNPMQYLRFISVSLQKKIF